MTDTCATCNGQGYVITAPAVYPPHWNAHPEEAEPCEDCDVAVAKGWLPGRVEADAVARELYGPLLDKLNG